jgi:hypothetical protein
MKKGGRGDTEAEASEAQIRTRKINYLFYLHKGSYIRRYLRLVEEVEQLLPTNMESATVIGELISVGLQMQKLLDKETGILNRLSDLNKAVNRRGERKV